MNYSQIAAEAKEDFKNISAYSLGPKNIKRLEELFKFNSYLNTKITDLDLMVHYAPELEKRIEEEKTKINEQINKLQERSASFIKLFRENQKNFEKECVIYYDPKGNKNYRPDNWPFNYAPEEKVLNIPKCKEQESEFQKIGKYLKSLQKQIEEKEEELKSPKINKNLIRLVVLDNLYKKIAQFGLEFMNQIPIIFKRGRGPEWKGRHSEGVLFGYYQTKSLDKKIYIRTHFKGKELPKDTIYQVCLHELMHAYSDSLSYAADKLKKFFGNRDPDFIPEIITGIDDESEEIHKKMMRKGFEPDDSYRYGSSETYARGGGPTLRLYLNRLKGKKGTALNDDLEAKDIYIGCKKGMEMAVSSYSYSQKHIPFGDLDPQLEVLFNRSLACEKFRDEGKNFLSNKFKKSIDLEEFFTLYSIHEAEIIEFLDKEFINDQNFRSEFENFATQINRIAKKETPEQDQQTAIAEFKDLRELFKRFLK